MFTDLLEEHSAFICRIKIVQKDLNLRHPCANLRYRETVLDLRNVIKSEGRKIELHVKFNRLIVNSIQFISCSVDPNGVLTHRIWNMSIYKYTSMYKLSILSKKYPIKTRFNILPGVISYNNVSYNNAVPVSYNNMVSYINKEYM
jgi:hypothetical protein